MMSADTASKTTPGRRADHHGKRKESAKKVTALGDLSRVGQVGHWFSFHGRTQRPSPAAVSGLVAVDIEEEVTALEELDGAALRQRWNELVGSPAPGTSPKLLRLALAWRMQVDALGGLSPAVRRKLAQAAGKSVARSAGAGTRLVREWQGVVHVVTIDENGIIRWNDRNWKSLSAVARAITGGHWSGPAFFGLRKSVQRRADKPDLNGARKVRQEPSPTTPSSKIVRQGRAV